MGEDGAARRRSGEKRRRYLKWGRIGVTVAAVGYLASRVDPRDVVAHDVREARLERGDGQLAHARVDRPGQGVGCCCVMQ